MANLKMFRRDVVVSVRPKYADEILRGAKTVELRRRFPEAAATGALALIYSSSPVRAIVGYARIKAVHKLPVETIWRVFGVKACISMKDFDQYFLGLDIGYAIVLEGVRTLRNQVKATDLRRMFDFVPPQSFRYITNEHISLLEDGQLQMSHRQQRRHRP